MLEYSFMGVYMFRAGRVNACKAVLGRPGRQRFTRLAFVHWWQAQAYGLAVRARYSRMWCQPNMIQDWGESPLHASLFATRWYFEMLAKLYGVPGDMIQREKMRGKSILDFHIITDPSMRDGEIGILSSDVVRRKMMERRRK